jgi:hypothetical protein
MRICDLNCAWLHPKEYEQSKQKEKHICQRYNKIVKHNGYHPELIAVEECLYNSFSIEK